MLLMINAEVENQNTFGVCTSCQFGCPLFTIYALVKPANIIIMLPMPTHSANLCGCILFLCVLTVPITMFQKFQLQNSKFQ